MRETPTHAGTIIDEKYQVLDSIGAGGMSVVWLARDTRLGKLWAIKEIKPNEAGVRGELMRQALVDEAHLMKRLDHPAIPRVVDIIETGLSTYVVMDYVEGSSLARLLSRQGRPFAQELAIDWGIQLCDVLSYLHRLQPPLVYRDMKPSNVMLREDGSVRLIDFGIAMECVEGRANDGRIVGTPGYAAPEQLGKMEGEAEPVPAQDCPAQDCSKSAALRPPGGRDVSAAGMALREDCVVDGRADVYALGMTLYTLVTGHRPKRTRTAGGTMRTSFEVRPIRMWDPQLSEGLELVILRATRRDPRERYASVEEMRYDLEHHVELTHEWRDMQRRKVRKLLYTLLSAVVCAAVGVASLYGGMAVRGASYEGRLHAASLASVDTVGEEPSKAELELVEALRIDPSRQEAYEALLKVYESDYMLSRAEEARLRSAFGTAKDLEGGPGYARLCFNVGICYLCYYGVDQGGGSVGNVAIASAEGAEPWFRRAIECCDDSASTSSGISGQDLRAARTYLLISRFYDEVTRYGREGTSGEGTYRELWDALATALGDEVRADPAQRSAEGVRARLCQVASEALSSPTYLGGFARCGVGEEEAKGLLGLTSQCVDDLHDFAAAEEYREVYAPMFAQIDEGLDLAKMTIAATYHNPIASLEEETP